MRDCPAEQPGREHAKDGPGAGRLFNTAGQTQALGCVPIYLVRMNNDDGSPSKHGKRSIKRATDHPSVRPTACPSVSQSDSPAALRVE